MKEKTTKANNAISYIKHNYPRTEQEFQILLNNMRLILIN